MYMFSDWSGCRALQCASRHRTAKVSHVTCRLARVCEDTAEITSLSIAWAHVIYMSFILGHLLKISVRGLVRCLEHNGAHAVGHA
jgi:hypothetical protein